MKSRVLLLIFLILIIPLSSALQINLLEPHTEAWLYSSTVIFKCQINPEGGYVDTVRLFTSVGGFWSQTGTTFNNPNPTNLFNATFTVQGVNNGNYIWNCLANGQYSSTNSTFTISTPENLAPVFSGPIPNQTWNQDTSKNSAFDLDNYFSDPESTTITYTILDADGTIIISKDSSNVISFSQPSGWWGPDKIKFKACDTGGKCTDSNEVVLTVTQISQSNNPPTISGVSDQTREVGDGWTVGLDSKISDTEDSDSLLNINVSGVDTSIFTVSVNDELNELTFEAVSEGSDTFTIRVTDTKLAYAEQSVTVTIEETSSSPTTTSDESDEFSEQDEEISLEITTVNPPDNKKVVLNPGQPQVFKITTNEEAGIVWYVDEKKQTGSLDTFTYKPSEADIGMHVVKVIVGSSPDIDSRVWDIEVKSNITKPADLCGNKVIDKNETCLSCPKDVPCKEGEYCDEGMCKQKASNLLTGYFVKSKNFVIDKWYYPTLVFGVILLLIITAKILNINKKQKPEDPLVQFSEKLTWKERLRRRLRNWDRKRLLKRQNKENFKKLEAERKYDIRATAPGIESIITFINQKINEGHPNRVIKKTLRKRGWSRWQIRKAFKKIKNDSRKPA